LRTLKLEPRLIDALHFTHFCSILCEFKADNYALVSDEDFDAIEAVGQCFEDALESVSCGLFTKPVIVEGVSVLHYGYTFGPHCNSSDILSVYGIQEDDLGPILAALNQVGYRSRNATPFCASLLDMYQVVDSARSAAHKQ
jgi:hypothetical protein